MNKKNRFIPLLAGIVFFLSSFLPAFSVQADELSGKFTVEAAAALSVDADSGKIFYSQNSDKPLGIASITKIIGLYLVEKEIENGKLAWDDEVEISEPLAALSVHSELSNVPLEADKTYTVRELFDSAVIQSANASIMALAEKIAGSEAKFVDMMKKQLEDWGITDAKIVNSSGLSNVFLGKNIYPGSKKEDENEMSAKDVAIVARHLLQDYPDFLKTSATVKQEFGAHTTSKMEMQTWNWMLPGLNNEKKGVDGLKTGTTDLAGACFVGTMEKDGLRIITVVLNAKNHEKDPGARFVETGRLMDYTYDNWKQATVLTKGDAVPGLPDVLVHQGEEFAAPVAVGKDVDMWLHSSVKVEDLVFETTINKDLLTEGALQAPVAKNTEIGNVTIQSKDTLGYLGEEKHVDQTTIVTSEEVQKANVFVIAWRTVKGWFN